MKVVAKHGFVYFYPQRPDDLIRFKRTFGVTLAAENDYFTFPALVGLPRYSITGAMYGNLPALKTYEGRDAAEVMRENGFVYSLKAEALVPKQLILGAVTLSQTLNYAIAPMVFLQPGLRLSTGERLLGYNGTIDLFYQKLYLFSRETEL